MQCAALDGCIRAVVLIGASRRGPFRPIAQWPAEEGGAVTPALRSAATAALRQGKTVAASLGLSAGEVHEAGDMIACPLRHDGNLLGVVAVELRSRDEEEHRRTTAAIEANSAALALVLRPRQGDVDAKTRGIIDVVAASVEHASFDAAARSATSRVAAIGRFDQVTLGFVDRGRSRVLAVSGRASADPNMSGARRTGRAIDEAIAADQTLIHTSGEAGAACTIPVAYEGVLVGGLLFEHTDADHFDAANTAFCEACTAVAGPILYEKYLKDRGWVRNLAATAGAAKDSLLGRGNRWRVVTALLCAALLAIPCIVFGNYRVTANASIEGAVQRIVAAPVDGFVAAAPARAGDVVAEGQLLARLDDRDLELERLKWSSEKSQLQREYREAMAEHDSTRVTILRAQLDRATAQLGLTEERIARARIVAPMAGVVVAGDLSQSLGAPVEKGQNLFEIAPLDAYRVMLQVDERDIGQLDEGQRGRLALVGLPGESLPFRVVRITPVATQAEGRNFFLAEAELDASPPPLRPGMDGIGKVDVGERRLIWIWTHRLVDRLRLAAWRWWS